MLRETKPRHRQAANQINSKRKWPTSSNHQAFRPYNPNTTLYGIIVQYELTRSTPLRTIKSPPVNPKGRNILDTIKTLREAGYEANRIEVIPGPPGREGRNFITEQQLSINPELEYLSFVLFFNDNSAGLQYIALGRQYGSSGQRDSPQFGCKVGFAKKRSFDEEVQSLVEIVKKSAFDYKYTNFGPIKPDKLPYSKYPFI